MCIFSRICVILNLKKYIFAFNVLQELEKIGIWMKYETHADTRL